MVSPFCILITLVNSKKVKQIILVYWIHFCIYHAHKYFRQKFHCLDDCFCFSLKWQWNQQTNQRVLLNVNKPSFGTGVPSILEHVYNKWHYDNQEWLYSKGYPHVSIVSHESNYTRVWRYWWVNNRQPSHLGTEPVPESHLDGKQ